MPENGSSPVTIRTATCDDAYALGEAHLSSWRTSYRGIGIDEFLDNHTVDQRAAMWERILCDPESKSFVYVAEDKGRIVGFAAGGPESSGDAEYKGELYALYLLQEYQRKGIGRMLVQATAERLVRSGVSSMLIWVLAINNPARFFYEACGGEAVRERPLNWGGKTFDEIGYGWPDLSLMHWDEPAR